MSFYETVINQKPLDFYMWSPIPSYSAVKSLCASCSMAFHGEEVQGGKKQLRSHKLCLQSTKRSQILQCKYLTPQPLLSAFTLAQHDAGWIPEKPMGHHRCLLHQPISFYMGKYNLDRRSCFLTIYISSLCAYAIQHSKSHACLQQSFPASCRQLHTGNILFRTFRLNISHTSFKLHNPSKSFFKQKAHLARFSATAPFCVFLGKT